MPFKSVSHGISLLKSAYRILDEFRSLRWAPLQPKFLDYENAQFLLIGSSTDDLGEATEQQPKDEKADKDTPLEEMEKLEDEDTARVEHLKGMSYTSEPGSLPNASSQVQSTDSF